MRLFVAVPLADEVRAALTDVQARLRAAGADVRWVEPKNFHLTVTFLGDLDDALLDDVQAACAAVAAETPPFRLRLRGASSFPKRGPAIKTLWVGVPEGAEPWKALVKRAEPWFLPMGVAREGGLVPHVTLGRVKSEKNIDSLRAALAAEAETECGSQAADRIVLIQSFLDPAGATYEERAAWPLTGED
jgi:2''-5'' RNA ligase